VRTSARSFWSLARGTRLIAGHGEDRHWNDRARPARSLEWSIRTTGGGKPRQSGGGLRPEGARAAPESIESPAPVTPPIPSSPLSAASALAVRTPVLPPPPSFLRSSPRERALVSAAEAGDLREVRRLFAAGVSPHARGANGMTPLMAAVANNHAKTALALLDRGADVNARDSGGLTPLMIAASSNHPTLLRVLLARGAHVNARSEEGWTPLIYAAWQGHAYLALPASRGRGRSHRRRQDRMDRARVREVARRASWPAPTGRRRSPGPCR
jgi:Ankyrin repeats (many copies)